MNEISLWENHGSKEHAKLLEKILTPIQIAQSMQIQTDIAYAMKDERIKNAKAECDARRARRAARNKINNQ